MAVPEDIDQWITDVREVALPVFSTGILLLVVVLGIPPLVAGLLVVIPMVAVQAVAAQRTFWPPEEDWPHG